MFFLLENILQKTKTTFSSKLGILKDQICPRTFIFVAVASPNILTSSFLGLSRLYNQASLAKAQPKSSREEEEEAAAGQNKKTN